MDLQEFIESIDIVDYIAQFVELEEKNGEFWGLSPFKEENTPSFSVRRETGKFYDFSSGLGGSVVSFVKKYNHCSGQQAIEILKAYAGCDGEEIVPREKMSATKVCKKYMPAGERKQRKHKEKVPQDYMERYEDRVDKLQSWLDEGISLDAMKDFGVKYDSFSDRIVYPIRDISGEIVNVGGRTLDPDYKGKRLRKYTYFFEWGGTMDIVYGLFENMKDILDKREVILFEGVKSVLIAKTWGINNTACILTSHLNENQMKVLAKLGCRCVFALDKEVNIRQDKNIQRLRNYVDVYYLWDRDGFLDDKDSPVDRGQNAFEKLYEGRIRYR